MVVDCCYFMNEQELFDIRYNILKDHVNLFIVAEGYHTFSGREKGFNFVNSYPNVIHFKIDPTDYYEMARKSPNTGAGEHYWVEEFAQKEALQDALSGLSDDDFVYISDLDEIWRPGCVTHFGDAVYKPKQLPYLYYFNQRTDENWLGWTGTVATKYKNIKNGCINHLRTDSMTDYEVIENGGWHFNSIGGRQKKQEAFRHPIYENESEWRRREIGLFKDDSDLPQYLLDNKEKYAHLFC